MKSFPDHMEQIASWIDLVNRKVGHTVAWLALSMAIVTFLVATFRYGLNIGWVWFQETYVWMHGTIIMMAMAYTLMAGAHVRVDIIYRSANVRYRAIVDIIGTVFLLIPSLVVIAKYTVPYVLLSWQRFEISREAGGLHGLFLFKTTMLFFFILLFLQCIAILIRATLSFFTGEYPQEHEGQVQGAADG